VPVSLRAGGRGRHVRAWTSVWCCRDWGEWREDFIVVAFLLTPQNKERVSQRAGAQSKIAWVRTTQRGGKSHKSAHDRTPSKPRDGFHWRGTYSIGHTISLTTSHAPPYGHGFGLPLGVARSGGQAHRRPPRAPPCVGVNLLYRPIRHGGTKRRLQRREAPRDGSAPVQSSRQPPAERS
jgi:hypothetical protein